LPAQRCSNGCLQKINVHVAGFAAKRFNLSYNIDSGP
jgi:hypothetical protein